MPDTSGPAAWASLDARWRRCLELAWMSYQAGSIPVGAVVIGPEGSIVAEGRNQTFERAAETGLAGSLIAHAEVNALSRLEPGEYGDHELWSSLEPCFLCAAAASHSHVGAVRYAAADPVVDGVKRLPELNSWLARRWPAVHGPEQGPLSWFAGVLHLVWHMEKRPDGVVVQTRTAADPWLADLARMTVGTLAGLRDAEVSEAWTAVVEAATEPGEAGENALADLE